MTTKIIRRKECRHLKCVPSCAKEIKNVRQTLFSKAKISTKSIVNDKSDHSLAHHTILAFEVNVCSCTFDILNKDVSIESKRHPVNCLSDSFIDHHDFQPVISMVIKKGLNLGLVNKYGRVCIKSIPANISETAQ